ncbi:hypothetical protein BC938DRAFT_478512 [Jimgerdemannia flammicorona]|uniref:C2H2-type domain-containing protein n=1 Tax=Jimgerdemannia flammicorona TaxID=994334 RepID=A0A433P5B5_9FUNG|nr:hypothetical protein BC938DRAFT_478512 [Jimgerdemannia flammicorona]
MAGRWKFQCGARMLLNHEYPHPTSSSPNSTPAPHDPDALFLLTGLSNDKDFRPYLCTHSGCTKSFTTLDQLASHESKMHGARDVVCGVDGCTRGFATRGQLIKHQKMVHFRRPGMGRRKKGVVAPVVVKSEGKEEGVKIERVEGEGGEGTGREEEEEEEEVTRVKVENGV